jgi:hypothetical protein
MNRIIKRPLSRADLNRFSKICGLFSSTFEGERSNAASLAHQFLCDRGLEWGDVLLASSLPPTSKSADWQQLVLACRACPERLSEWERAFIATVATYRKDPSGKQAKILATIAAKVAKL